MERATRETNESVNGAGQPLVSPEAQHHLWLPNSHPAKITKSLYHLKLDILRSNEERGDCAPKIFAFESLHDLRYSINQLEAEFKDMEIRKCGVDGPDAMGGRVNDDTCENVTIEFKETANVPWNDFLATLRALESGWAEV